MFNIDKLGFHRRTLAHAFVGRLMSILEDDHATERQKVQAKKTPDCVELLRSIPADRTTGNETSDKRSNYVNNQTIRERISWNMRGPVPISSRLLPALQLKSMKHRALACRWHLGVFPVHYRYLSSIVLHMCLDDLWSLSHKKVTNLELRKIRIALTVLSSIPELDCCTAVES